MGIFQKKVKERHRLNQRDLGRRIAGFSHSDRQVFKGIEPDTL